MNFIRERNAVIAVAALAAGLSACKGKDQYASTDTTAARADSAAGTAMSKPAMATNTDTANKPAAKWSDASILAYAWAANNGEVQLGQLGEKKATSAAVKSFARRMVTDHKSMMAEGKTVASKSNVTPDTTADDAHDLINHGRDEMKELTDKTAGADWDKNYMDKMVDDHQKVLDKLQDAAKNTTNTEIRAMLEKATGKVQQHLTKAQDIVKNTLKS